MFAGSDLQVSSLTFKVVLKQVQAGLLHLQAVEVGSLPLHPEAFGVPFLLKPHVLSLDAHDSVFSPLLLLAVQTLQAAG